VRQPTPGKKNEVADMMFINSYDYKNVRSAITFAARVQLTGTGTNKLGGVDQITVGFVQHGSLKKFQSNFPNVTLKRDADSKYHLDTNASSPFLSQDPQLDPDSLLSGKELTAAQRSKLITNADGPSYFHPVKYQGALAKSIELQEAFNLDIAALTNQANTFVWGEYLAAWSWCADGTIDANENYAATDKAGVKLVKGWTAVGAPTLEDIAKPTFNNVVLKAGWKK
jgi:hypothetical protein